MKILNIVALGLLQAMLSNTASSAFLAVQQFTQEPKSVLATPHSQQQSPRDAASAL
jgi:hypothetical protein